MGTETITNSCGDEPLTVGNPPPWPPDLQALFVFLRDAGFKIGAAEALRAIGLLERLSEGERPRDAQETALWLGPILCTTPRQQATFPGYLEAFAALVARHDKRMEAPDSQRGRSAVSDEPTAPASVSRLMRWIILYAAAVVFLSVSPSRIDGLGWFSANRHQSTEESQPRTTNGLDVIVYESMPVIALPLLVWLFIVRLKRSRRAALARGLAGGSPATTLLPKKAAFDVFSACEQSAQQTPAAQEQAHRLRVALQGIRAHRYMAHASFDPRASVKATVAAAGALRLIPGRRPRLPEYPVLVEQRASRDHLPELGRALSTCLEGIHHGVYFFDTDPRHVRTGVSSDPTTSLSDVASRYNEDTLILLSDGECLLDPLLGQLPPWTMEMLNWSVVVLLTPVPRHRWSWRERRLCSAGIVVLPATHEGLTLFGDFLRAQSKPPRLPFEQPAARLSLLCRKGFDRCAGTRIRRPAMTNAIESLRPSPWNSRRGPSS